DRKNQLEPDELTDENRAQTETVKHQTDAVQRLQRLLDSLKDQPLAKRPKKKNDKGDPKQNEGDGNKLGGPGDGIPDIAQLKALPEEQNDLNERTRAFVERHIAILVAGGGAAGPAPIDPQMLPLTDAQRAELNQLQADQAGLRELFDLIAGQKDNPKEGNPKGE